MLRSLIALALVASGCGSRCKEVNHARDALATRTTNARRGADVRVTVPFERANALFAESLAASPLEVRLDPPRLGPLEITITELTAHVREVRLLPGEPGKVRFAIWVAIHDPEAEVATLHLVAEVAPRLERGGEATALVIGFGPENLVSVKPELGPDASASMGRAVSRWVPTRLRDKLPRPVLDAAAARLGTHLTGGAYDVLRETVLVRLGELTRMNLRLPDVPADKVDIRSSPVRLVVEIRTDLPVRGAGLSPAGDDATEVSVAMSGSAVAELANWAIDEGHAPAWYTRGLAPSPGGEFRPRFDYIAEDRAHPFKVYAFQERGGCSYFRVGVRATVALDGDTLAVTAVDRELEASAANPVIEVAAWVKYFLTGSLDRGKRVAAHTQLTVGGRTLETRVVGAALTGDELRFALRFTARAPASAELLVEPRDQRRERLAMADEPVRECGLVQDPAR